MSVLSTLFLDGMLNAGPFFIFQGSKKCFVNETYFRKRFLRYSKTQNIKMNNKTADKSTCLLSRQFFRIAGKKAPAFILCYNFH